MKIALGSDHAGFALKEALKKQLMKAGHEIKDFGAYSKESCDYPDFAFLVAGEVLEGKYERGILVCGSGVGMSIAANRLRGIRAALVSDLHTAKQSRAHGDTNILCLGAKRIKPPLANKIVTTWLATPFSNEERHLRRIKKIDREG